MKRNVLAICIAVLLITGCQVEDPGAGDEDRPVQPDSPPATATVKPVVLSAADFQYKVLESDRPVLVDFTAGWCPPCGKMAPVVEQVSAEYRDRALVGQVDFDQNKALARRYGIELLPTFMLFVDGREIERVSGIQPKQVLCDMLEGALGD